MPFSDNSSRLLACLCEALLLLIDLTFTDMYLHKYSCSDLLIFNQKFGLKRSGFIDLKRQCPMIVNIFIIVYIVVFIVLQNGVKIKEVCVGKTNSAQIYHNHYSRAIIGDLMKHFHHT